MTRSTWSTPRTERTRSGAGSKANSSILRSDSLPTPSTCDSIVANDSKLCGTGSVATNHPNPCRAAISPSSRTSSSARRIVTRETPNSTDISASDGSTEPAGAVVARRRNSSAISW